MQLDLTADQLLFHDTTVRFIETELPLARTRELHDHPAGYERAWLRRSAELGWFAMLVPEADGGGSVSGDGLLDAAIVAEALGRHVQPGPFIPMNVVAGAIAAGGTAEQRAELLPAIAAGELVATWAFADERGNWDGGSGLRVERSGADLVMTGRRGYVLDAASADWLLVAASLDDTPVAAPRPPPITPACTSARSPVSTCRAAWPTSTSTVLSSCPTPCSRRRSGAARSPAQARPRLELRRHRRGHRRPLHHDRHLREGPHRVRPTDRVVPGAQAPHGRPGVVPRDVQGGGGRRGQSGAGRRRRRERDRQHGGRLRWRRRQRAGAGVPADPRRHRLHLGARPPPLPAPRAIEQRALFGEPSWHRERVCACHQLGEQGAA